MPISFTCPHCGAQTTVADEFAGKTGPCAQCGKTISIPALGAMGAPRPSSGAGAGMSIALILGIVVIGGVCVVGILIALLLPAVQAAREAARRSQCTNNLKQIALALHVYHDTWNSFPPAYVADASGRPMHSWRVLILPYLEHAHLYERYDFDEPWDGPNNSQLASQMPPTYSCPSDPAVGANTTHYVVVVGPGTMFDPETPAQLAKLTAADGAANTLMVVESTDAVNWMAPDDLDFNTMSFTINDPAGNALGSHHAAGANAAFADASVRFLNAQTPSETVRGLITTSGGEAVSVY
jgi:type II secretory pathway pseudopilin PulG